MRWRYPCAGNYHHRVPVRMNWHPKWWRPDSLRPDPLCRAGYAVCVDFPDDRQIRRWSDECKAATPRRNLERRINKIAPCLLKNDCAGA
jgi:hypothetical protein